jgi:hypothetical protein
MDVSFLIDELECIGMRFEIAQRSPGPLAIAIWYPPGSPKPENGFTLSASYEPPPAKLTQL